MFAASSSAYGDTDELPKHEEMLPQPLSPTPRASSPASITSRVYAQTMGLDGVSLRYFNVFGPRQDPSSPYSGVISLFATVMAPGPAADDLRRRPQTRDFTYVQRRRRQPRRDAVAERRSAGRVFNVGTGRRISLLDLVAAINPVLGTRLEPAVRAGSRSRTVRDARRSARPDPRRPRR